MILADGSRICKHRKIWTLAWKLVGEAKIDLARDLDGKEPK